MLIGNQNQKCICGHDYCCILVLFTQVKLMLVVLKSIFTYFTSVYIRLDNKNHNYIYIVALSHSKYPDLPNPLVSHYIGSYSTLPYPILPYLPTYQPYLPIQPPYCSSCIHTFTLYSTLPYLSTALFTTDMNISSEAN